MEWFGIFLLLVVAVLYYKLTTPEERMHTQDRINANNKAVLGKSFSLLGFLFKRLR